MKPTTEQTLKATGTVKQGRRPMFKPFPAIKIVVEGGCVQSVYADSQCTVTVLDYDSLEAEGKTNKEAERFVIGEISGLLCVY